MKKIVVYWRDIPAQVIVQRGRRREKRPLSARFQEAIDRAAMRAGKGSSDAYIAEWRRVSERCADDADPRAVLAADVERLEADYSDARLEQLVRAHGEERG